RALLARVPQRAVTADVAELGVRDARNVAALAPRAGRAALGARARGRASVRRCRSRGLRDREERQTTVDSCRTRRRSLNPAAPKCRSNRLTGATLRPGPP